jgi:hypothetical protein
MRKLRAGLAVTLMGLLLAIGVRFAPAAAPPQADARNEDRLVGTWEHVSAQLPDGYRHIKHITPTHWTWVVYHRDTMVAVGVAGGTWSLEGDRYKERIEFATESNKDLRGKEFAFTLKLEGDSWFLKSVPDSELQVDETWKRVGPAR